MVHEGNRPNKCEICDFATFHKNDLNRHILKVHEEHMEQENTMLIQGNIDEGETQNSIKCNGILENDTIQDNIDEGEMQNSIKCNKTIR